MTIRSILLTLCALYLCCFVFAGGVRGKITDESDQPLAYATIFVKQTGTGTVSNTDGLYEIPLQPGSYELVFQYLGYETQVKEITVTEDLFVTLNIILKSQVTVLQTVTVRGGDEDPAYAIMRKAIAKAAYHQNQLNAYTAKVYVKGSGKLIDYPWLAKKALEKEGVEKNKVYLSESISEIKFTRPNKFEERVISIRSDGKDNNTNPTPFIFGSFYEPEIAEVITPFSPRAFGYYRFEYAGTFKDRNYDVSKIKVIPRSKGDNVVAGELYIVEDWWSIHSFDFSTTKLGIRINMKAMYAPIEDKVWLPVSHRFKIEGKIFGFEFEYNYLATEKDYRIEINPDIYIPPQNLELTDQQPQVQPSKRTASSLQEKMASGKEISRKELKTFMKEYEKQELQEIEEPEVVWDLSFKIDSGAYIKDSAYWVEVRPIPLTSEEIIGYRKADSLAEIQQKKEAGDTVKVSKHKGFQPWDLIIGDRYSWSKQSHFEIRPLVPHFNTVEGFNLVSRVIFGSVSKDSSHTKFKISPVLRYSFEREIVTGFLTTSLEGKGKYISLSGGKYVEQFSPDQPIHPLVNDFTTLFLEKNLMKIYERTFVDIEYKSKVNPFLSLTSSISWSKRHELENQSDFKLVNSEYVEGYTDNRPDNLELEDTAFPDHQAFVATLGFTYKPWLKFRIRNGERFEIPASSPAFSLHYRKGFDQFLSSDVDFDLIEGGISHALEVGARGTLLFSLKGGVFLNNNKMYFMDYKHFIGNQTPFITTDPVGSFRLMDYYLFSTSDRHFSANLNYNFRKFLITSIPIVRLAGIRENVFLNYLATPTSSNYMELGYALDGILRIFRIEAAASFEEGRFRNYGFRLGIASYINID